MTVLSIGLPVYNGERFVKEAIESMLAQSFGDFELIISDNASTDSTGDICRELARKDRRVRYFRNATNLGASWNFNRVFEHSVGEYFKWIANDDIYEPSCLEKCLNVMKADPSVVLCYPGTKRIDENGRYIGDYGLKLADIGSSDPVKRFKDLTFNAHACFQIFGLMRRKTLERTNRFGNYSGADRVLISEMSLYGRLHELPEALFLRRSHPHESRMLYPDRNQRVAWFDPSRANQIVFSEWRLLSEYCRAVKSAPLTFNEKMRCYLLICELLQKNLRPLVHDLKSAAQKALMS